MRPWKTLSRRTVLDRGKFLSVQDHTVQLPDGRVLSEWPWVVTPDYVNIVAVTEDGDFLCFRQVKYAIEGTSLAPIGGYIDPGESSLAAAQRELLEETGYRAPEWIELGRFPVDGNRGVCMAYLYLASGAHRVAEIDADDLEEQELRYLSRTEIERALDAGAFKLLPWTTVFALALRHLDRAEPSPSG